MAGVRRVDTRELAAALADRLNGDQRDRPVVVVTIPAAREEPWIDVEEIAREAGDLAEVYLMPTGAFTWEFSHRMAEGTQVYGGAGRVYPVGHEWATDLSRSPLRFAFDAADGERSTKALISDAWRMAAAAGLTAPRRNRALRRVEGVVKAIVAGRALVDVGNLMPATVAQELTIDDVPIERILVEGQRVEGDYDPDTNRLDVTGSLRPAEEALAGYQVGAVVRARVVEVREDEAVVLLYPRTSTPAVTVTVPRDDVTTNPHDDLRTLMTAGEVVTVRLAAAQGSHWLVVLDDVDDDEPVVDAPSLLPGGPPWLSDEPGHADLDGGSSPSAVPGLVQASPSPISNPSATDPSASPSRARESSSSALPTPADLALASAAAPPAPAPPRPSPRMLDRRAPRPGPPGGPPQSAPAGGPVSRPPAPAPQRSETTTALVLRIEELKAQVERLTRAHADLREQIEALDRERDQLRYLYDQAERRANRAEHELTAARSRLRKAGSKRTTQPAAVGPQFADPEQGFRYLVLTQWATRTLPSEQQDRPLQDYLIGPQFLESLARLEGIKAEKVADVAFEIVTGLATDSGSREVHRLRSGPGGEDPVRTRSDGAVAWRASLQVNSPSARRIHYWVLPDGRVELARVTTHDDFDI